MQVAAMRRDTFETVTMVTVISVTTAQGMLLDGCLWMAFFV